MTAIASAIVCAGACACADGRVGSGADATAGIGTGAQESGDGDESGPDTNPSSGPPGTTGSAETGTGGDDADDGPDVPDPPAATCQLDAPAFCEDFEAPHPGGEAGPLDEAKWGVSRWGQFVGNSFLFWPASSDPSTDPVATFCGESFSGLVFPDSFAVCDGQDASGTASRQLNEVFDDNEGFAFHSMLIRQPFDFTDRTGTIAMDVELKFNPYNVGHGAWIEVWVVEDPAVVPYHGAPAVESYPRNGVGFAFEGFNCDHEAWLNSVTRVVVTEDWEIVRDEGSSDCFQTEESVLNHLEIRLSADTAEVWVSDAGDPSSFRQVGSYDGLGLSFTRGHVVLQHSSYNAVKDGAPPSQTYRWDNVGFDGPLLPRVRGYDVPDNDAEGGERFGWEVDGAGQAFTVQDVDPTDMGSALFNISVWPHEDDAGFEFRLNGGPWHAFAVPYAATGYALHSYAVPVDLAEVTAGTNTIEVRATGQSLPIGNLDLTLLP